MTQLEKFSLHFPHGLVIDILNYKQDYVGIKTSKVNGHYFIYEDLYLTYDGGATGKSVKSDCKPYFRSFDQLAKECVQADYNDGKPFVPVEEIKKELLHSDMEWGKHSAYEWIGFSDNKSNHIPVLFLNDFSEECPFWIFNLLLKWHFCVGFEQGEYIEVTNENNPY